MHLVRHLGLCTHLSRVALAERVTFQIHPPHTNGPEDAEHQAVAGVKQK